MKHKKGGQTAVGGKLNQWGFKLKLRKCVCMCMSSIVVGKIGTFFKKPGRVLVWMNIGSSSRATLNLIHFQFFF